MVLFFRHPISYSISAAVVLDSVVVLGSVYLGYGVRFFGTHHLFGQDYPSILFKGLPIAIVFQSIFYLNDLYDFKARINTITRIKKITISCGLAILLLMVIYYIFPSIKIGRGIFLIAGGFIYAFLTSWRLLYHRFFYSYPLKAGKVMIMGTGEKAWMLDELLSNGNIPEFDLVGFIDQLSPGDSLVPEYKILGHNKDLLHLVSEYNINKIVVSMEERRNTFPLKDILDCKMSGVGVADFFSFYEQLTGKILIQGLYPSWLIFSDGFHISKSLRMAKRAMDILLAFIGLTLSLPLIPLIYLSIKIFSEGPVFYRQERVGEKGKTFTLLKFRTMAQDAEAETGPLWAQENDARVTRVGRFLRKTRLDEIPQMINILRGEMSFVGPRPERPFFVNILQERVPYYNQRHIVKPGITGWAQVRYRYGSSIEDSIEKLQYDLYYLKNISLSLDLLILLETAKVILFVKGAI